MQRRIELELMEDEEQVKAYAQADFEEAHKLFARLFQETFGEKIAGWILDLGCGPAKIALRIAALYPHCTVVGVDGSAAMLRCAETFVAQSPFAGRVVLRPGIIPHLSLEPRKYDAIISNSVLHHLRHPHVLWETVNRFAKEGTAVFIMDLKRPAAEEDAQRLVEQYAATQPPGLRKDFYNSFLAAFEPAEIQEQLRQAGLEYLAVQEVSDRHWTVSGHIR